MTITKLVTVFESYETEAEALERYKAEETEEKEDAAVAGQGVGR
jgi:hypothetical protein